MSPIDTYTDTKPTSLISPEDQKVVTFIDTIKEMGVKIHPRERNVYLPLLTVANLRPPVDEYVQDGIVYAAREITKYLDYNAMEDPFESTSEGEDQRKTFESLLRKEFGDEIFDTFYYQNNALRANKTTGVLGWMQLLARNIRRTNPDSSAMVTSIWRP